MLKNSTINNTCQPQNGKKTVKFHGNSAIFGLNPSCSKSQRRNNPAWLVPFYGILSYKKGDNTVYSFSGVRGPTINAAGREKPPSANGKGSSGYRGLYRSSNGTVINADLNASANIGRKALPKMFTDGQMPDFNKVIVIKRPDDANKLLGLET